MLRFIWDSFSLPLHFSVSIQVELFKMKFSLILFFLIFISVYSENIFYEKLDKLLNYCSDNVWELDNGNLLGISIAKKILSKTKSRSTENLFKKCSMLENAFFKFKKSFPSDFTDLGELNTI